MPHSARSSRQRVIRSSERRISGCRGLAADGKSISIHHFYINFSPKRPDNIHTHERENEKKAHPIPWWWGGAASVNTCRGESTKAREWVIDEPPRQLPLRIIAAKSCKMLQKVEKNSYRSINFQGKATGEKMPIGKIQAQSIVLFKYCCMNQQNSKGAECSSWKHRICSWHALKLMHNRNIFLMSID